VGLVGAQDVLLVRGGGEDHHRDPLELGVALHRGEHLAPVHARKVQVEQDEVGPLRGGVLALAPQEAHGLLAVADDVEVVGELRLLERSSGEHDVGRVVLDEEDLGQVGCALDGHSAAGSTQILPP